MSTKQKSSDVILALQKMSSPSKAKTSAWFFKTGVGQYGHGDVFIGVTVPEQRLIARTYRDLGLTELHKLLRSPIHEHRLTALHILVLQFQSATKSADSAARERIVEFYLDHVDRINNWDLVDSSAKYILGEYFLINNSESKYGRDLLYKMTMSHNIWERRIAIISTHAFIAHDDFADTLQISEMLLSDTHDLMHKAVGWMLREVGKRSPATLRGFLDKHAHQMPRTSLRYAIEKFSETERKSYLGR